VLGIYAFHTPSIPPGEPDMKAAARLPFHALYPVLPPPIRLGRRWPARWAVSLAQWCAGALRQRRREIARRAAWRAASELSPRLLEDIAAPGWMRGASAQHAARHRAERELLRLGIVSGQPW
jgi:hypothetical protein